MAEPLPIAAFNEIINSTLQEFLALSAEIGSPVEEAAVLAEQAFLRLRDLIIFGLYNDRPPKDFFTRHPLNAAIESLVNFSEEHRNSDHVKCLSSSILALNWIAAEKNPCSIIKEMKDSGAYFGNRILRMKEGPHRNWVKKLLQVMEEMLNYVKSYHLTGFTYGALRGGANVAVPPPPPPPPPPAELEHIGDGEVIEHGQGDRMRQELLNELNQGTDITRRLRPMQRRGGRRHLPQHAPPPHEGPAQVAPAAPAQVAPAVPAQAAPAAPAQAAPRAIVRPPRCELEGRKWVVEYYRNAEGITVENNNMSESVSIYNVESSSIEIAHKCNSVVVDNCKRTNIMVHGVVGSVSLVRSSRISIQFDDTVPLLNVDNCESIQIFLNQSSRNVVIISSQSQAINVCLLRDDGDYVELPIPEQIRTEILGQQLRSTVYENRG